MQQETIKVARIRTILIRLALNFTVNKRGLHSSHLRIQCFTISFTTFFLLPQVLLTLHGQTEKGSDFCNLENFKKIFLEDFNNAA